MLGSMDQTSKAQSPVGQEPCVAYEDEFDPFQNTDLWEVLPIYIFYIALDMVYYFSSRYSLVDI